MGDFLRVSCADCDYSEEVIEGYGFASIGYEPMVCLDCRRAVSVAQAIASEETAISHGLELPQIGRCPECSGERRVPIPLDGEAIEDRPGARASPYPGRMAGPCPRCSGSLILESVESGTEVAGLTALRDWLDPRVGMTRNTPNHGRSLDERSDAGDPGRGG